MAGLRSAAGTSLTPSRVRMRRLIAAHDLVEKAG
jgi:hypothetical protein